MLETSTPFLLYLADIDRLGVFFNNTTNTLTGPKANIPVVRK